MIKVNMFSFQNINALNGTAKFAKLFTENDCFFKDNGIQMEVFSNSSSFSDEEIFRKGLRYKLNQWIKKILSFTVLGNIILVRIAIFRNAEKAVNQYLSSNCRDDKDNTVFLFNDYFTLLHFSKIAPDKKNLIFIMHNNGDVLKMLFDKYPRYKKSKEAHKLMSSQISILRKVDLIVFVSKKAQERFNKTYPFFKEKTKTVYIGHKDSGQISKCGTESLKMITVGTVSKRKNQMGVLKALTEIGDPDIHYTIVGDGPMLNRCKNYITKKELCKQVFLVGSKNNVKHYMLDCNLYISNSRDEGLPIAAQEALECGLPVITTDVGGCSELIEGNGICIKPGNQNLVKAIKDINSRKSLLDGMMKNSRTLFLKKFTLETMFDQYLEIFKNMCKGVK